MKIQHLHIFSQARLRLLIGLPAAVSLVVGLGAPAIVGAEGSKKDSFEVWLVDQSNTNGLTHGGTVYIYDGEDVTGQNASSATPTDVINLSAETSALCLLATGANPVRPHMLMFNQAETHALLAFVASGHVVIFNAQTRQPVACLRTELGAGAARQAHQVIATGDDQFLLVTNQNGKKLERIRTDYTNNVFTQEPGATLNLATCTTPNGLPCQDPTLRPDNAPVFVFNQSATDPAWVNLRGGGILVADWRTMPMSIIGEYDKTHLPVDGGMFGQAKGRVFGTGGAPNQFTVYRLPVSGYAASNPPNTPAPEILLDDNSPGRDAHGVEATKHDRYIWVDDRAGNVIEVFDSQTANGSLYLPEGQTLFRVIRTLRKAVIPAC